MDRSDCRDRRGRILSPLAAALVVTALLGLGGGSRAQASDAARYVDLYGLADPVEHPAVRRAERMFERLRRLDGQVSPSARLLVIDSANKPWAIALPDDTVVLSRGALDIVYRDADTERGDAELAFVLGHELAHLRTRDLWHQMVHASLAGGDDEALLTLEAALADASLDLAAWRDRELRADELGYVLAALGGFAVERLLGEGERASDFLSVWVEQTRAQGSRTHYAADERTAFLRQRLRETSAHIDTFDMGVMLAHFGRHADALPFFEAFHRRYPSAEVLSNIGYVQLQLARQAMPPSLAYRFWMPTLLETDSGLRVPTRGFVRELPAPARELLERATASLDAAVRRNEANVIARVNLAVAQWYLGRVYHARATIEDAVARRPDDPQLRALRALILLEQDPEVDMGPRVIGVLEELSAAEDAPLNVLFNLARVLDERGREARADAVYARLHARAAEMPAVYARQVCRRVERDGACEEGGTGAAHPLTDSDLFTVAPGVRLAEVVDRSPSVVRAVRRSTVGGLEVARVEVDGGYLLALDGVVEVAVARPDEAWPRASLDEVLGEPRVILSAGAGRIEAFGGGLSALVHGESVSELWRVR